MTMMVCTVGETDGAVQFSHDRESYIDLSNSDGKLNYYGSFTLAFWIYLEQQETFFSNFFDQADQ